MLVTSLVNIFSNLKTQKQLCTLVEQKKGGEVVLGLGNSCDTPAIIIPKM